MHRFRKLSITIVAILSIIQLYAFYVYIAENRPKNENLISGTPKNRQYVQFVKNHNGSRASRTYRKYDIINKKISVFEIPTKNAYEDFNSSLCYKNGTDVSGMRRIGTTWKCECLSGYHGTDCAQPEVIWRALLAYRGGKSLQIKPRSVERKIYYVFQFDETTRTIIDIRIQETYDVVDLFVFFKIDSTSNVYDIEYFNRRHRDKIVIFTLKSDEMIWDKMMESIQLNYDDLIVISGANEIVNKAALGFFKLYDGFPDIISFRLRRSVYGFFWIHPQKTIIKTLAFTVKHLSNINDLSHQRIMSKPSNFIVGDLNHFGGWYCEYCNDPDLIIKQMQNEARVNVNSKIDVDKIEDFIENGVYTDDKTELIRAHRFQETYFAPECLQNSRYDYLMINIYSKMDYYE